MLLPKTGTKETMCREVFKILSCQICLAVDVVFLAFWLFWLYTAVAVRLLREVMEPLAYNPLSLLFKSI